MRHCITGNINWSARTDSELRIASENYKLRYASEASRLGLRLDLISNSLIVRISEIKAEMWRRITDHCAKCGTYIN